MFEIFLGVYIIGFLICWPLVSRSWYFEERKKKNEFNDGEIASSLFIGFLISLFWFIWAPINIGFVGLKYLFFPEAILNKRKK